MSVTEIMVILFGLFIGYWLVSRFITGPTKNEPPSAQPQAKRSQPPPFQEAPSSPAWHQILNVSPQASDSQIRRAYQTLMSQYHPDKVAALGEDLKTLCERKTKEINIAYDQAMQQRSSGV